MEGKNTNKSEENGKGSMKKGSAGDSSLKQQNSKADSTTTSTYEEHPDLNEEEKRSKSELVKPSKAATPDTNDITKRQTLDPRENKYSSSDASKEL